MESFTVKMSAKGCILLW